MERFFKRVAGFPESHRHLANENVLTVTDCVLVRMLVVRIIVQVGSFKLQVRPESDIE